MSTRPAFDTLTDSDRRALTISGTAFLKAVSSAYGSEVGMDIFAKLTAELPGVSDSVWMNMLGAHHFENFVASTNYNPAGYGSGPNKIMVIKCIREFTCLGLKEAKDIADTFFPGSRRFTAAEMDGGSVENLEKLADGLRKLGVTIT
jgi:hypothetical protein